MTIWRWLGAIALIWTLCGIVVASYGAMHFDMVVMVMIFDWTMEIAVVMVMCVPCVNIAMITMIT
jgi:hypothetical protein